MTTVETTTLCGEWSWTPDGDLVRCDRPLEHEGPHFEKTGREGQGTGHSEAVGWWWGDGSPTAYWG